ncbi:MAG: sigma-70 family RNA polymerase sigma factor [Deltaproteobacteria bacterium]|nr:sigma-70 family RNA polymerase sigma factor [Deltaproteobacteria bacterium]
MSEQRPTDEELMLAYQAGDVNAFEELFSRYKTRLYQYLRHLLGDAAQAEDVLQTLFMRIHRARAGYRPQAQFSTWVYTIARNLVRDVWAKHSVAKRHERITPASHEEEPVTAAEMGDPDAPTPEALLEHKQTAARVQHALLALSPEAREVLVLHKFEGLRFAQIAEVLGCSVSAAKVRAFRALKALQAALHEKGSLC